MPGEQPQGARSQHRTLTCKGVCGTAETRKEEFMHGGSMERGLIFVPCFWHRTSKTLGISCMIGMKGASLVIHKSLSIILDFVLMR